MTVSTFYSATTDGDIFCSSALYAPARAGTGTKSAATGAEALKIGQRLLSATYYCYETFLTFDTSTIPDGDSVTAVTLSLGRPADNSLTDFVIEVRLYDWGAGLETADFIAGANLGSYTLLASLDSSLWSGDGTYVALTSETAFLGAINKTGSTRVVVCSSRQRIGNQPASGEWVETYSGDYAGNKPKLEVTHTVTAQTVSPPLISTGGTFAPFVYFPGGPLSAYPPLISVGGIFAPSVVRGPTPPTLPRLIIEADLTTPPLTMPTEWLDLSDRLRSMSISQGRERLLDRTEVGQASLLLDNRDRVLDPTVGFTPPPSVEGSWGAPYGGAYWGGTEPLGGATVVRPGDHLRIRAVHNDVTYDLFRGFVRSWGQDWPGGGFDAVSRVDVEDAFALMARYELEGDAIASLPTGAHLEAVLDVYGWPATGSIPTGTVWWTLGTAGSALGTNTYLGEVLRDFDDGQATIMALNLEGNLLDHLLNAAETTEGGTFYVGPSGDLIFNERPTVHSPSAGTWGDVEGELRYFDLSMRYDDDQIYNDVRVTRRGDATVSSTTNAVSITDYGQRTLTISDTLYSSTEQATEAAVHYLNKYKDPVLYPTRMVMRPKPESPLWDVILGMQLGTRITVRRRPPGGGDPLELDCLILGVDYSVDQFWEITWRLAPAEVLLSGYWYLGFVGSSELGTTTKLG